MWKNSTGSQMIRTRSTISLASLSIVTFLFYGFDKLTAKFEKQRIPEIVFHALALAGEGASVLVNDLGGSRVELSLATSGP